MKKLILSISGVTLSMAILSSTAMADDIPPSGSIPISKIITNIYSQGYETINEVEYDDGFYEATVIDENGQEQYLHIDPTTGKVPTPKSDSKHIKMSEAIKAVPQDKCETITAVEKNANDSFEVNCLDQDKQEVTVLIDGVSGKVVQINNDD